MPNFMPVRNRPWISSAAIAAALRSVHHPRMTKIHTPGLFDSRDDAAPPTRVAFDIEIANVIELAPGEDLEAHGPFDISCAAAVDDRGKTRHWYTKDEHGEPGPKLSASGAREMLQWLREQQLAGVKVYAWNGLSFDVRWLGHVAEDMQLAKEIALELYDPMFQFVCQRGFPVSLANVAEGLGLTEKKLMSGEQAPIEWARGNRQLVLDYVAGDCRLTEAVVARIVAQREIRWKTKKGTFSSEPMPALRSVRQALAIPLPDTSWMREPLRREKFYAWCGDVR